MRIAFLGVSPLFILFNLIPTVMVCIRNGPSIKLHERDLIHQNISNDDGGCSLKSMDPFFKFTIDNLLESQAIEAYTEWVYNHALLDMQLQQYGEVRLFGIRVLNDPALHCGKGSCSPEFQCEEMRELVHSGFREEARRRYFITLMIKYTFDYMQDIIDAATVVQAEIKDRVIELLNSFTENKEAQQIATCETVNSISWGLRQAAHSLSVFYNNTFASQIDAAKASGLVKPSEADAVKARVLQEASNLEERGQQYMQPEISLVEGKEANILVQDYLKGYAIDANPASRMNKMVAKKKDGGIYRVYPSNGDWLRTADGRLQKVSAFPDWTNSSAYRRLAYQQMFRNETWRLGWQRDSWFHVEAIDPRTGSSYGVQPGTDALAANYTRTSCNSGKSFIPNTPVREKVVINRISAVFDASIEDIRDRMQLLAGGTAGGSGLVDAMEGGFFLGHLDVNTMQPLTSLAVLKETMRQKSYEAVISNLLAGEHCYAKCVPASNTTEIILKGQENDRKSATPFKPFRFVPQQNIVCQWECISKKDSWSRQLQLFGINKFANYSLDLQEISVASFHAWKDDHRNAENIKAKVATAPHDTQFRMPTCDSEFNVINDFRETDFLDRNQLFPVCCGNWRCNETKVFMNAVKMNTSDNALLHYVGKSAALAAHKTLIRPYTHWNALCELGIQYNSKNSEYRDGAGFKINILPKPDDACSALAEQTRNMTEDEANIFFCEDQGVAKTVMKNEGKVWLGRWTPPYRLPTHREMCDDKNRVPNPKCLKSDEENYARRSDPKISEVEFRRERDDNCE